MAPQEQPKRRINARRVAARALQQQNPGMTYRQARARIAESPGSTDVSTPLRIRTLLNVVSAEDIAARHRGAVFNMAVPVGISDAGDAATLNIVHAAVHPDRTGPMA